MNESELEKQLRALRPAAPSANLAKAISRELDDLSTVSHTPGEPALLHGGDSLLSRLFRGLPWAAGGAVAAAITIIGLKPVGEADAPRELAISSPAPVIAAQVAGVFEPEESSNEVIDTEESALIFHEQREPARLVRVNSLERRTWANAATGARIAVEVPREDLMLVPVSYQ